MYDVRVGFHVSWGMVTTGLLGGKPGRADDLEVAAQEGITLSVIWGDVRSRFVMEQRGRETAGVRTLGDTGRVADVRQDWSSPCKTCSAALVAESRSGIRCIGECSGRESF